MYKSAKREDMEIITTIGEATQRINSLNKPAETIIHIVIEEKLPAKSNGPSKWAKLSERIKKNAPLKGAGVDVLKDSREFRDNYTL